MKVYKSWILFAICIICSISARSQAPFSRGINLTGWFQVSSPGQIQFTRFTRQDISNIKSLGCDVIRLPVNMHAMTSGSPSYTIDPLLFVFLDSVVTWCEEFQIYMILDNHSFDPNINTSPDVVNILVKVWSQIALHYKNRSDYLLYEILNEPHGISTSAWGVIQNHAINAIRAHDTNHTIVVGGSGYNTYTELKNLPVYADTNLLYTFHFYDPFVFTHQGASWVSPSMEPLSGVPFPYDAARMPLCPASLKGTWIEAGINSYSSTGTVSQVKSLINNAISFRDARHVKIFCGEFGVLMPNSPPADRTYWYNIVRQYLEENNIPWTIWDYKGGFGLFNKDSNELFENDFNVSLLQALDFNIPVQTPFSIKPDSTGFLIYSDYIGQKVFDVSYGTGSINFYSSDLPNNNNFCIYWNGFSQYSIIGFDFGPDKDLTRLVSEDYAIDFMVRGNVPEIKFDIRFIDTKSEIPDDHPWRMGATIDETDAAWDRKWHHIYIPVSSFNERGAWDNNTWYNPVGKFDWSAVDRFEICAEYTGTSGKLLWFDNIHITNMDTAIIREYGTVGIEKILTKTVLALNVAPNPMKFSTTISYDLPKQSRISVSISSITGIKIRNLANEVQLPGNQLITWDGLDDNGVPVPVGVYIIKAMTPEFAGACKIIKF